MRILYTVPYGLSSLFRKKIDKYTRLLPKSTPKPSRRKKMTRLKGFSNGSKTCFVYSILKDGFARIDRTNEFGVEFEFSIVGHKTVYFLFHIVKLGVAESEKIGTVE